MEKEKASLEQILEFRSKHHKFGKILGTKIMKLEPGHAHVRLDVREELYNPIHSVHGGVIFSLADIAAGTAAASYGTKLTTMDASIQFLAAAMDSKVLDAHAYVIKRGKTVSVLEVTIKDERDRLISKSTFSYFELGIPITVDDLKDISEAASESAIEYTRSKSSETRDGNES